MAFNYITQIASRILILSKDPQTGGSFLLQYPQFKKNY